MRVLYASHFGEFGGAERSLFELMIAVRDRGIEPALICPVGSLQRAAGDAGIPVAPWSARRLRRVHRARSLLALGDGWRDLDRAIARFRPHAVHANTTQAMLWMGPVPALRRCATVWHWRDFDDRPGLARLLARGCNVAIAISQAMFDHATDILGRTRCPIVLVRNGVADPTDPCPGGVVRRRHELEIPLNATLVAMGGQSIPRKGHAVLLAALRGLAARGRDTYGLLVCSEHDVAARSHTRRLRQLAGGDRLIRIVEGVASLDATLRAADIVAVPSLREPFGRVAVEAMLAGRPLVASAVDGLREIIADGHDGILVPPNDPVCLANGIERILDASETWRLRGVAARARALRLFSISRVGDEMAAVYRSLDARAVPPSRPAAGYRSTRPQPVGHTFASRGSSR